MGNTGEGGSASGQWVLWAGGQRKDRAGRDTNGLSSSLFMLANILDSGFLLNTWICIITVWLVAGNDGQGEERWTP